MSDAEYGVHALAFTYYSRIVPAPAINSLKGVALSDNTPSSLPKHTVSVRGIVTVDGWCSRYL
jgi:hypothetical protein